MIHMWKTENLCVSLIFQGSAYVNEIDLRDSLLNASETFQDAPKTTQEVSKGEIDGF